MSVKIVSPKGNVEVWPEKLVEQKLKEGYITFDVYEARVKAKAEAEHQAWLTSPDTEEERFRMLRAARDAKLAETDYLVAPDYPLAESRSASVRAYRQALRDLPEAEGAPWDGGGELTPWPVKP